MRNPVLANTGLVTPGYAPVPNLKTGLRTLLFECRWKATEREKRSKEDWRTSAGSAPIPRFIRTRKGWECSAQPGTATNNLQKTSLTLGQGPSAPPLTTLAPRATVSETRAIHAIKALSHRTPTVHPRQSTSTPPGSAPLSASLGSLVERQSRRRRKARRCSAPRRAGQRPLGLGPPPFGLQDHWARWWRISQGGSPCPLHKRAKCWLHLRGAICAM